MSKSAKKVLEAAYGLVESWAVGPDYSIVPLFEALKKYDQERFFKAVEHGITVLKAKEALKAGGSAQQKP